MKINSSFVFTFLLVSYALAVENLPHETTTQETGATDKVEPAGVGGGNWGGGGGGGNWGGGGGGNWGGGGCRHGCCYRGSYGCQRCCSSPEEAKANVEKNKVEPAGGGGGGNWGGGGGGGGGNWGGGGGGGCHHGCCSHGRYGCQQCCSSPEEAKAYAEKNKVEPAGGGGGGSWGGGGGGGGCHHGCCNHGRYGCQQCCSSPEEAKAYAEKQTANP